MIEVKFFVSCLVAAFLLGVIITLWGINLLEKYLTKRRK